MRRIATGGPGFERATYCAPFRPRFDEVAHPCSRGHRRISRADGAPIHSQETRYIMKNSCKWALPLSVLVPLFLSAAAHGPLFRVTNLLSDGTVAAPNVNPNLQNPWGIAASPTGPIWISDNGTGNTSIVKGDGTQALPDIGVPGAPTGIVFNGTDGFRVSSSGNSAPSLFLFATENGTLLGWNPAVDANAAIGVADLSSADAVFKGLALATVDGRPFLYATDFANGVVRRFDQDFGRVGTFTDGSLPRNYAPFGIANLGSVLGVTFALREEGGDDDVPGAGHGFVDLFDFEGNLVERLVSQGELDSPWGLAIAPGGFGNVSGNLLVGNFGDGRILAYNLHNGHFRGALENESGRPIVIDGLWGLMFGNGAFGTDPKGLYFTAGIDDEAHGLFGVIQTGH
jgi:uncharacterized protein (TIGR03118 family)